MRIRPNPLQRTSLTRKIINVLSEHATTLTHQPEVARRLNTRISGPTHRLDSGRYKRITGSKWIRDDV